MFKQAVIPGYRHEDLSLHGYGFAWFDRLPGGDAEGRSSGAPGGRPFWYYVMSRSFAV